MLFIEFMKQKSTHIIILNIVVIAIGLVGYLTSSGFVYDAYTSIKADEEWRSMNSFTYNKLLSYYSDTIDDINSIFQEYQPTSPPEHLHFYKPIVLPEIDLDFDWIRSEGEKLLHDTTANNICNSDTIKSWDKYFTMVEENFDKMLSVMETKRKIFPQSFPVCSFNKFDKRMKKQIREQGWGSSEHSRRCDASMKHKKEKLEQLDSSKLNAWAFLVIWLQGIVLLMADKQSLSILLGFYALVFFVCFITGGCLQRQTPDAFLPRWLAEKELSNIGGAFMGAFTTGCGYLVRLLQAEVREERKDRERQVRQVRERRAEEARRMAAAEAARIAARKAAIAVEEARKAEAAREAAEAAVAEAAIAEAASSKATPSNVVPEAR